MQRVRINLYPSQDRDGKIFHVGKFSSPITINFKDGVAFLVYLDTEFPEIHFCPITSPDVEDCFKYYEHRRLNPNRSKHNNLPLDLHKKYEKNPEDGEEPRAFYVGKIQFNGKLECSNGVVFLVFTSDENEEELQIAVVDPTKTYTRKTQRSEDYEGK